MTEDKLRYWLNEGLLGEPIQRGFRGKRHLLSFKQLLRARTIRDLWGKLRFPLQKVRLVIKELSDAAFLSGKEWHSLDFVWTPEGEIGVYYAYEVRTGQLIIPRALLPDLQEIAREARKDWVRGEIEITNHPRLVSNARIVAGSPTIRGTRIETSFIARPQFCYSSSVPDTSTCDSAPIVPGTLRPDLPSAPLLLHRAPVIVADETECYFCG